MEYYLDVHKLELLDDIFSPFAKPHNKVYLTEGKREVKDNLRNKEVPSYLTF